MSLACAVRAIFAGLVSAIALRVVLRRKHAYLRTGARLAGRMLHVASLLRAKRKKGALITRIGAGSPAEKVGLKTGDVIIRFAGHRVMNAEQLRKLVDAAQAGTDAQIDVVRDGRSKFFRVTMAKSPPASAPVNPSSREMD